MKRGEIWWHESPESKRRPVLIITRNIAIDRLDKLLVVPATGRIRDIPTEVEIGRADGLPQDGVLSLDNTSLVRKSHLTEPLSDLSAERMAEVCAALGTATSCG